LISATSNPFNITINAPAPTDIWSSENVLGSYNSGTDVWTPGKGSDGRITAVSWNSLPTRRWVRVAGSRLDSLQAAVVAALPGYNDIGNGDWGGNAAWGGFALDKVTNNPRAWYFGGGHLDSANNGLYRFDFNKMTWNIEILPLHQSNFDAAYYSVGSYTGYPPAATYTTNNPNQNEIFSDCFYPEYPNTPTARHVYASLTYDHVRNKVFMGSRRMWVADITTKTWSVRYPFHQNAGAYPNGGYYGGENMIGLWDSVNEVYIVSASQGFGWVYAYDPDTEAFTTRPSALGGGSWWACAKCQHENTAWAFLRPDEANVSAPTLFTLDIPTWNQVGLPVTGTGANNLWPNYQDTLAMCYVPQEDKFLVNGNVRDVYPGGSHNQWFWLDRTTRVLERTTLDGIGTSADYAGDGEGKLHYLPQLQAVVWMPYGDSELRIMKF
jgi:hypothetical protein